MSIDDAYILVGIGIFVALGVFLNGWRFAHMTSNPFAGKRLFGQPVEGSELSVEQINCIGRLQMVGAPVFMIGFVAIATQL